MKPLRKIITDALIEMKDSNLSSEAARERIADKITGEHAREMVGVLKNIINKPCDCPTCKRH